MVQEGSIFIQIYVSIHSIITLIFSKNRPIWTLDWLVVLKCLFSFVFLIFSHLQFHALCSKNPFFLSLNSLSFLNYHKNALTETGPSPSPSLSPSLSNSTYIYHISIPNKLSLPLLSKTLFPLTESDNSPTTSLTFLNQSSVVAIRLAQLPPV